MRLIIILLAALASSSASALVPLPDGAKSCIEGQMIDLFAKKAVPYQQTSSELGMRAMRNCGFAETFDQHQYAAGERYADSVFERLYEEREIAESKAQSTHDKAPELTGGKPSGYDWLPFIEEQRKKQHEGSSIISTTLQVLITLVLAAFTGIGALLHGVSIYPLGVAFVVVLYWREIAANKALRSKLHRMTPPEPEIIEPERMEPLFDVKPYEERKWSNWNEYCQKTR